ncbi:MAG TPA: VWA domain-containing protein [Thermoanaerobaculia bacterium]|nr:VWA domain-containing protein [Thermoanaerobaculia bacterium]
MSRSFVAAALATVVALASGVGRQPARAQVFGERLAVVEVEIPVHVLRGGEPVAGLGAEDFLVLDDGEPREIVGFRVIDLTRADGSAAGASGDGAQAVETAGEAEGRRILLLFDFLFSRPHYLERSLLGAREMVGRQLHPADRVAVATLSGGGAEVLLGFTRDREEIEAALGAVEAILDRRPGLARERLARLSIPAGDGPDEGAETAPRRTRAAELNERFGAAAAVAMLGGAAATGDNAAFSVAFDSAPGSFGGRDSEVEADPVVGQVAYSEPEQIGASFAAAGQASAIRTLAEEIGRLATLLRDVPGQKQLLYLSQGFSSGTLASFASGSRALVLRYLETMFEALRRGGWTLHAVDVEGVPDPFASGFDADALYYMANETGGLLFENYNRIHQATEKLVERTSLTYVLTIHPGELPADGRLHRLEVRLREPAGRTRVLHRTGYYAPKPASRQTPLELQMDTVDLLLGEEEIDGLGVRLLAGALPAAGGLVPVPVVIEVPAVDLLAGRDSGTLDLELQVYAVDARDGVQDLWLRSLRLDLDQVAATLVRGGVRVLGGLALPPGEYRLRALVREPESGRVSLWTTPLRVDGGGLLPLDPVAIDRSGAWLELVALPSGPGGAPAEALALGPSLVVPPVAPRVEAAQGLEFLVVTPAGVAVELQGRLLDAAGRPVAPPAAVVFVDRLASAEGTLVRHLGRATTAELAPGSYRLEVSALGSAGESPAARSLLFAVIPD